MSASAHFESAQQVLQSHITTQGRLLEFKSCLQLHHTMSLNGNQDLFLPVSCRANLQAGDSQNRGPGQKKVTFTNAAPATNTPYRPINQARSFPPSALSHHTGRGIPTLSSGSVSLSSASVPLSQHVVTRNAGPVTRSHSLVTSSPTHAPELHHFTLCSHTSPPANRPLNAQPTNSFLPSHTTTVSTIEGRCHHCDTTHRRNLETHILSQYRNQIADKEDRHRILRAATHAGDSFAMRALERDIAELVAEREEDVESVWEGYSARWGPGTIGFENTQGRMRVEWIRPDRREDRNRSRR